MILCTKYNKISFGYFGPVYINFLIDINDVLGDLTDVKGERNHRSTPEESNSPCTT